jgi:hypothetical protein
MKIIHTIQIALGARNRFLQATEHTETPALAAHPGAVPNGNRDSPWSSTVRRLRFRRGAGTGLHFDVCALHSAARPRFSVELAAANSLSSPMDSHSDRRQDLIPAVNTVNI